MNDAICLHDLKFSRVQFYMEEFFTLCRRMASFIFRRQKKNYKVQPLVGEDSQHIFSGIGFKRKFTVKTG